MANEVKNYKDYSIAYASSLIIAEVGELGESRGWHGEQDVPAKFAELQEVMARSDIFHLDDMYGSWGLKKHDQPEDLHIVYTVHPGYLNFRMSDGSSGSTPHQTVDEFKRYWTTKFSNRKVTYEEIKKESD